MDKKIEQAITLLQQGKQLPEEYLDVLFPIGQKEYELTYKGKKKNKTADNKFLNYLSAAPCAKAQALNQCV